MINQVSYWHSERKPTL